jgi:hypothetical protein
MKRRRKPALQYVGGFTPVADEHHCIRNGDYVAWVVLMELYARARRKPGYANAARGRVHLDRGQCLFGLRELAARVGASVSAVRWKLRKLCVLGAVTIDASATGSIATIPFLAGSPATTSNVSETERAPSSTLAARSTARSTAHSGPATCAPIDDPAHPTRSNSTLNSTLHARSTHLTDTGAEGDTGVGASRHNSSKREGLGEEGIDPRVVELHAYQEKHRRRALREAYRPIHVSAVSRQIAERLEDHSIADCKAVIRADASEVGGGGKASYFGVNTWSAKNFGIKLPQQLQAEQERREPPPASTVPGHARCFPA